MSIKYLEKDKYSGYTYKVKYKTDSVYRLYKKELGFEFKLEKLDKPITKGFESELYKDYGYDFKVYGYFIGDELVGFIQFYKEWSNRLRIFEFFVFEEFRRQGIASQLMDYAKEYAQKEECRGLILETQSCNIKALNFYFNYGFELGGLDSTCYSNSDIDNNEVRMELYYIL